MRLNRALGGLAMAVVALSACEPAKAELLPLEVAKYQAPKPLVTETTARIAPEPTFPEVPVRIGDTYWQATATEYELPENFVRPVATIDGLMFHSFAWDEEPFDRLLVRSPTVPGRWVEFSHVY